tara:strand:+ start:333 stop:779 length:447 start_codon:yes stop_codon:yes gene_type:complete
MGQAAMFISVASTLVGAKMQRDAYEMEAQANEEQANMAELEAEQQANSRRNQLLQVMSAMNASEASRGLTVGEGGTSEAFKQNEKKMAQSDLSSIKLMGLSKRRQYSLGAGQSRLAGKASVISGLASAGGEYATFREKTKSKNKSIRN